MLAARARAQVLTESASGDAWEINGENPAAVTTASVKRRKFMRVFLEGQKYQRPAFTMDSIHVYDKR